MTPDFSALCKTAGADQALADLGLIPSDAEMEKQAFVSGAFGALGKGILGGATRLGAPKWALKGMETVGKGMGRDAALFGTLGGGLSALTAPEGERGKAFARGFLGGAAGGAAWAGGQNIARAGLGKMLGKTQGGISRLGKLEELGKSHHWLGFGGAKGPAWEQRLEGMSWLQRKNPFTRWKGTMTGGGPWGERFKRFGAKAGVGIPVFAGGMGASMFVPQEIDVGGLLASKPQHPLPLQQQQQRTGPLMLHPGTFVRAGQAAAGY